MAETSLHQALKDWYAQPGDQIEASLDGYQIDILRGDLLIEIQTRQFNAIRPKLHDLLERHPVRLVFPIPETRWIVRMDKKGRKEISRRRSPKRGRVEHVFTELVRIPDLIAHPGFTLEALFTEEEQILVDDGQGSWRRKGWSISDRRLLRVKGSAAFETRADFLRLLPDGLPERFTTRDLAEGLHAPRQVAQKMAYCLKKMGLIAPDGRQARSILYRLSVELPQSGDPS